MPLSTQPYKGARDFYPEDKRFQKFMFGKLRQSVESFGYEEYDAPILESIDLYRAKSGAEIVNEQTYSFTDRGGREVVIRPEMTPTVSRMVAAKRQELSYPLRWYSIPNLWRYERPQRGRLREHWQLNVDIFGVDNAEAELEIISLVDTVFKNFGASPDMYLIQLNSRALIDHILNVYLGLDADTSYVVAKLIDRKHKMSSEAFTAAVVDATASYGSDIEPKLQAVLGAKQLIDLPAELQSVPAGIELAAVLGELNQRGIQNAQYDGSLMRGFDYYTGIVFEVSDTHPENNRSMMGGGRYDGLVGLFGVEPVATVGFGLGDATLANFLELHELVPPIGTETDLYVLLPSGVLPGLADVVTAVRSQGITVAIDLSGRKIGDQFKTADKKVIGNVLIIGEQELNGHCYKLKNLATGMEETVTVETIKTVLARFNDYHSDRN